MQNFFQRQPSARGEGWLRQSVRVGALVSAWVSARVAGMVVGGVLLVMLGGCAAVGGAGGASSDAAAATTTTGVVDDGSSPLVFATPTRGARGAGGTGDGAGASGAAQRNTASAGMWTIAIQSFRGIDAPQQAARLAQAIMASGALSDVYVDDRGDVVLVASGRYAAPDDDRAVRDLRRVRETRVDGATPFASAVLAPPTSVSGGGSMPEFDLATLKAREGRRAMYTLQVGIYRMPDGSTPDQRNLLQFRAAAEEAVRTLRAAGEEAFYYHGPRSSTVTVGVFGEDDLITHVRDENGLMQPLPRPRRSVKLVQTQERHPHNLVNGQAVRVGERARSGGDEEGAEGAQASFLIRVPG